jgi:translation initiation factor IF-2
MQVSGGSMSKVRVYEVAKQLNLDPKAVVGLFQAIGINDVRNHMSSVEPEAVERVKRHLEKQKTHDVVEERIRPTVVKRRAIAKPPGEASPSAPSLPNIPPSRESAVDLDMRQSSSGGGGEPNGNGHAAHSEVAVDRPSGRLPAIAEDRKSTRDVAVAHSAPPPPPAPPSAPAAAKSAPALPAERKSTRGVKRAAVEEAPRAEEAEAAPAPAAPAPPPPPSSVHEVEAAPPAATQRTPEAPEPMAASAVLHAADTAHAPSAVVEAAPPVVQHHAPPPPVHAPVAHAAPPPRIETPAPVAAPEPAARVPPKTGVEYWAGRPGVPMPTPMNAPRTGIGGGPAGAMPRRVQYDPRAGAATGPAARGNMMRPGGPQQRPGMMGRPGPGGRRGFGAAPMRKPSGIVSTQEMSAHKKVVRIEENVTLQSMAAKMSLKSTELLMKLLSMGMTGVHINTTLDADTAKILASEFGWEVEDVAVSEEDSLAAARGEESSKPITKPVAPVEGAPVVAAVVDEGLLTRPPVVTVMGHVDHGKTSLLDRIRKANVAGGEAGGITQHIGAYKVVTPNGTIVFLDTPGHEAFTQMRARGASVTDLVILVVAADDGVMPQTREAVNHAKAAKVPIIVAVNKIDKPSAEPERVRRELVELGLQPEEWGGDTIFVNVSATTGTGVDTLLEMIGLQAEVLDLKANPKKAASGTVLEALLDRGRGPVARVLVQDGTLKVGDFLLAGAGFGKVRAMTNEHGKQLHEAGPSTPVEILGLSDVPGAGDPMHAVKDPKKAMEIAESRKGKMARSLIPATAKVSLEELSKRMADSNQQELRVIIKGDVQGSVEAVADALVKISTEKVKLAVIHAGVGAITEGDINLAIAAKAVVIGFNVRPAGKSSALAEENKIEIRLYSIIYNAVDDVKSAMEGLLPATLVEKTNGKAEVRLVFKIKGQTVAGSYVIQGMVKRAGQVRLIREGAVVWEGKMAALKRFKDDVKDVAEGFECGITLDGFSDIKEKDIVESYDIEEVKQRL